MGCPGTKAEGHAPTKAERERSVQTMRQAKQERSSGTGKGETFGKGEPFGKGESHGKGAGGKGKGKGKGQHAGAATRVSVMEAAERGVASGDTDRLVKDILRAHLGL
jgi:hypothetical protein